jgi:rhamnosyltransferase subunit B
VSKLLHIILVGLGSAGDVHPNVALGRALVRRGHKVTLVAPSVFRNLAAQTGLEFFGLGTDAAHEEVIRNPDLWDPSKAFPLIAKRLILDFMRPVYEFIAGNYASGYTVVAAPGTAFGARIANEKLGVPLATVHLQPSILRSAINPATYMIPDITAPLPVWLRKLYFRAVDHFVIDRLLAPETNAFRKELQLPPVRNLFAGWIHSPQMVIGLFPEWFGPNAPDWPANFHHAGFPLWDERDVRPALPQLEAFLAAGSPPYVFTAGSAMMHAHDFFRTAAEVCRASSRRGVFIARYSEQIPSALPAGVKHFEYVAFSQILPRAAAFVHHGGIGTAAQALAAGVPQLVMPLAHDQFDNAVRLQRLGVADFVLRRNFKPENVGDALSRLAASPDVARACRHYADELAAANPFDVTSQRIESLNTSTTI